MVKSMIAAVLACLYVALSVWLVRSEGQSYRNSLKQARPAQAITASPVRRAHRSGGRIAEGRGRSAPGT